jgi:hypothetical protein
MSYDNTNKMSHTYARALQEAAEYLLSKPEFETETAGPYIYLGTYYDKSKFLAAARSLSPLAKEYTETQLKMSRTLPRDAKVHFEIARDKVCRKIQEAKWECEALLSPEEEASI